MSLSSVGRQVFGFVWWSLKLPVPAQHHLTDLAQEDSACVLSRPVRLGCSSYSFAWAEPWVVGHQRDHTDQDSCFSSVEMIEETFEETIEGPG